MDIRIGHGYDCHRLASSESGGRIMVLGGVKIECDLGPISHSDGDIVMHAVTDAILSAIGESDIGQLFPNTNPDYEGEDSKTFLLEALERANAASWVIGNVDITAICDQPKLEQHKEQICDSLRTLIGAPVNIKGKTHEGMDQSGAIEVHALALLQRNTPSL
ncbi:MAG: 2-C-methyl-D-erythritol 2,4-cyclodiphosphate synthase [Planctomycetota bacterium]|nr:2-C-methyl-D-erythritol 2,4-cyclodiphosphate synthase [Planctomycetota bacterium]